MDNEGIESQEVECCRFCDLNGLVLYADLHDRLFNTPGKWSLLQCPQCGFVWLNPRPLPAEIGKLYISYCTHGESDQDSRLKGPLADLGRSVLNYTGNLLHDPIEGYSLNSFLSRLLKLTLNARYVYRCRFLTEKGRGRRLLDVGCGNGRYLAKMQRLGWSVQGLEPDPVAAKIARERGVPVVTGALETAPFDEESFDAITMNHVIEHAIDPVDAFIRCRDLLRPAGRLVVVTPNLDSLGHKWLKEAFLHLDPPRHLNLFQRQTIIAFAKQPGLNVTVIKSVSYEATFTWVASKIIALNGCNPGMRNSESTWNLWVQGIGFSLVEGLINFFDRGVGEELILIARKDG